MYQPYLGSYHIFIHGDEIFSLGLPSAFPRLRSPKVAKNPLLSLKLGDATRSKRPLEEIMSEISRNAQARGLTPEILDSILNEE